MKRFTTLTAAIALTTSTAFAENYQTPKEPEPLTSCCDTPAPEVKTDGPGFADALPFILAIGAILVYSNSQREPSNPPCVTNQAYSGEKLDPYIIAECN